MVTDLAEVFRLGTLKEKENLAFRRFLSAGQHGEETFQRLAREVQCLVDCTVCANCCRHSLVAVNGAEILRIAAHLGSTPEAVTRLYTVPDTRAPDSRALLNSGDACVFLDGTLCMVYDARPEACRDFPHVSIGTHTLGSRPSSHARWAALCPIIYNAIERHKQLTGYHPQTSLVPASSRLPA